MSHFRLPLARSLPGLLTMTLIGALAASASVAIAATPDRANETSGGSDRRFEQKSCRYIYEWIDFARFPVQPTNGWATYTYLIQSSSRPNVGYVMRGQFPHGTYTSWDIYDGELNWRDGKKGSDFEPDPGSENPFRVDSPMLAENRDFSLLIAPKKRRRLAKSLRSIENRLDIPAPGDGNQDSASDYWIMVVRIYGALEDFNRGGYGGPDDLRFPRTVAVNLKTGKELNCARLTPVDSPARSSADMPSGTGGGHHEGLNLIPSLGEKLFLGGPTVPPVDRDTPAGDLLDEATCRATEDDDPPFIYQCAPKFPDDLIQFSRPPVGPGAAPADDGCSGYLGAAIDLDAPLLVSDSTSSGDPRIGLLRIPQIPTFVSNREVTSDTLYPQKEVKFYGLTMYGGDVGRYFRHDANSNSTYTNSIGNEEFLPDLDGGSTILLWPRKLGLAKQRLLFEHAEKKGWVVMRSGEETEFTTANLLLREKGTDLMYSRSYEKQKDGLSPGVPCFFADHEDVPWADLKEQPDYQTYIASPENMGTAAPMGVYCSVDETLTGACKARLQQYIESTGGQF